MKRVTSLLLAAALVLLAFTPAMSADYVCQLQDEEDEGVVLHEDNPDANENMHFGYNYLAKYRLPKLKLSIFRPEYEDDDDKKTQLEGFSVSWNFSFPSGNLKLKELGSDASGDIFVVSGFLPESTDNYTESFIVTATVVDIADDTYKPYAIGVSLSFDDGLDFEVTRDNDHTAATPVDFTRYVSSDTDIHEVDPNYSVTVTMSRDYDAILKSYGRYIQSDEDYTVNIPEWLSWKVTGVQEVFSNEELESEFEGRPAITAIVIKFNDKYEGKLLGDLQDGATARINIPFLSMDDELTDGILLSWDVTYRKPNPIAITSGKTLSFTLMPGSTDVKTAEYSGQNPVSIASSDVSSDVRFIIGHTDIDEATGKGTISVTAEASDSANEGQYVKTFTFTDTYGNSDTITATVTVRKPVVPTPPAPESDDHTPSKDITPTPTPSKDVTPQPVTRTITITGEPKTFSLKAGDSSSTTLTATGNFSGSITWTAGSVTPTADILVSCASSGSSSTKVSIVVGQSVAAGTYSVQITARDTAGTSSTTTLRITVTTPLVPTPLVSEDTNLTDKIAVKDEAGAEAKAKPFSALTAGSRAVYTFSLEGTGITAQAWRLLINGSAVDSAMYAAADSWARIIASDANSATVEADPPSDLSSDSQISLSVTGNDGNEYTADLGTVKKAETGETVQGLRGASSGGCNAGSAAMMLAAAVLLVSKSIMRRQA